MVNRIDVNGQILEEFLAESFESISCVGEQLIQYEKNFQDIKIVNLIYRKVHTLKGSAGFLGFQNLESMANLLESLFDYIRDGKIKASEQLVDVALRFVDNCFEILKSIEKSGKEGERDCRENRSTICQREGQPHDPKMFGNNFTIRIRTSILDRIVNTVGKLVLNRNQMIKSLEAREYSRMNRLGVQFDRITGQLHRDVMMARMRPLRGIFNNLARMVRDLSRFKGKQVRLKAVGHETELDKNLVDLIDRVLAHLVRNAVDHGIESAQDRKNAGKNEGGIIEITVSHKNGQVVIDVEDDGHGASPEKILKKAIEKGLVGKEQAEKYGLRDKFNLLFHPGFSMVDGVTNISGRGVGLDVVKSDIENVGGQIEVSSSEGKGMNFRLTIPLQRQVNFLGEINEHGT